MKLEGLWHLPVKLLLPTKNELGEHLDRDAKEVLAVNAKALLALRRYNLTLQLPHATIRREEGVLLTLPKMCSMPEIYL
jgi:hypothetical protein